jgi:hypothetical protein
MKRRACAKKGHRWLESFDGYRPVFQVCWRWGCRAVRVDPLLPSDVREHLEPEVPR